MATPAFAGRIRQSAVDPHASPHNRGTHVTMYPRTEGELQAALRACRDTDRDVILQNGRHTLSTDATDAEGAVVVNVEALSHVSVEGSTIVVGPAATMRAVAAAATHHHLFLPFRDVLLRTAAAGALSAEPGFLTRSAGPITRYLTSLRVVTRDAVALLLHRGEPRFDAVLERRDHSIITSLTFSALTAEEAQPYWLCFYYLPYTDDSFKNLVTSALEPGKLPGTVDLAVKLTLVSYGFPVVRLSVAGNRDSSDRDAVMNHVEHLVSADNLGEIPVEIAPLVFEGEHIVNAIVDAADAGAFSHGYASTKHTRLVRAERVPDFVGPYCKVIDAADGTDGDGIVYLNVSMKSQVCLTTDDNVFATAYLFVPPRGVRRHTEEQEKIEEFKRFLNHVLPLDVAPPARRSLRPPPVEPVTVPGALDEADLAVSAEYDMRSLGSLFISDPHKLALRRPVERIPGFKGEVFTQDDAQYEENAFQYATSSHEPKEEMTPYMVAYPEDVRDIRAAISFGKEQRKNIVARSGGHQYSGLSSGGDDTIVLSMDLFNTLSAQKGTLATVGVGARLTDIAAFFKNNGITIPHGECPLVAIGGHCQTGGYGHLLRGFGLALDYVHSFNIVLANGELMTVYKPTKPVNVQHSTTSKNDKIFWGVMGGGPNSFGILTDITFECIDDDDHPQSHGHKSLGLFNKDAFRSIMLEVQKWTKEIAAGRSDYLPDDLDMMSTAISSDLKFGKINLNFARNFFLKGFLLLEMVYGNEKGENASQEDVAKAKDMMTRIYKEVRKFRIVDISEKNHTPLSHLSDSFVRRSGTTTDGREFRFPYDKRLNGTKRALTDDFVTGFVDLVDETINNTDVRLVFQMGLGGASYLGKHKLGLASCSRRDVVFQVVYDVFYEEGKKDIAESFQKRMKELLERAFVGEGESVRLIWGSYGDTNINNVVENYYDSTELYHQLQSVKRQVDHTDVFHTRFTVQLPPSEPAPAPVPATDDDGTRRRRRCSVN